MKKNHPRALSRYELELYAGRQGGRVADETSGRYRVYQIEAPAGKVWAASSTHTLRVEWRLPAVAAERNEAVEDAIERMSHGTADCAEPGCDYCHPETT